MPNDANPDSTKLLELSRTDRDARIALFEQYRSFLNLVAKQKITWRVRSRLSASDVTQGTMFEANRHFGTFRGSSIKEFEVWLKRIHRNQLINHMKHHERQLRDVKREVPLFAKSEEGSVVQWIQPAGNNQTPSVNVIRGEHALKLADAIEALPPAQAEAVRLKYLEQKSIPEIAMEMEKSTAAIAGALRRGMESLRERLAGDESEFLR